MQDETKLPAQIVFVTDSKMFLPTLFAVYTTIQNISCRTNIHFWGFNLSPTEWIKLELLENLKDNVTIIRECLSSEDLHGSRLVGQHVTEAAMGRLHIPHKLTGRVLYIDGDVLIKSDLSPLLNYDLKGNYLGGVRDFVITRRNQQNYFKKNSTQQRTKELSKIMQGHDLSEYINSGVLLFDTDKIRADLRIFKKITNLQEASKWSLGDQDHINNIFKGKIKHLNPKWNASWGRCKEHTFLLRKYSDDGLEKKLSSNCIIHYPGAKKPWKRKTFRFWKSYDRSVIIYNYLKRKYLKKFPELNF